MGALLPIPPDRRGLQTECFTSCNLDALAQSIGTISRPPTIRLPGLARMRVFYTQLTIQQLQQQQSSTNILQNQSVHNNEQERLE